ncbi:transcriptional regulator [Pseudomonas chlororaphis]|uniref:transcriptional regulator n=1 Tax=Pseudomonas chlororaphis TaxID=587753 RepID=UPI003C1657A8
MKPAEAALAAAKILGSKAEMARLLDVRPPTVSQWCSGERPIPAARAVQIENLTQGQVKRESLCPGFPWSTAAA